MKKILASFMAAVLFLYCFASCSLTHRKNKWFSNDILEECLVPDMPKLTGEYLNKGGDEIYTNLSVNSFDAYIAELYEYLLSRNFKHIGTRGDLVASFSGTFYLKSADELSDYSNNDSCYRFVYTDGNSRDNDGNIVFYIIKIQSTGAHTLEYGNKTFKYNTVISLHAGSESALGGKYVLPTH